MKSGSPLVYFGTSEFAVPALRALAPHVVLVVSQPDRPAGRGRLLRPSPGKQAALELGLPVETPLKAREPEFVERVRSLGADALVVAAYGQILSESLLGAAKRGGINLHGSILPRYRGAAPIQRAILEGETETGATLMQMDKGMDTGPIIAIRKTDIHPNETAGQLEARLAEIGAEMAVEWMPRIASGDYPQTPQDDSQATPAPKMTPEDGRLTFEMEPEEAHRRFRACTPRPSAFVETRLGRLKLIEAGSPSLFRGTRNGEGAGGWGRLLGIEDDAAIVGFGGNALSLRRVQLEGRKPVSGKEFVNGLRLKPGNSLLAGAARGGASDLLE